MTIFAYEAVRKTFDNNEADFNEFSKLLMDAGHGVFEAGITKADADKMISEKFDQMLGLDRNSTVKERKRAFRNNKNLIFDVIVDYIDDMLTSGWTDNEFFKEWVDVRNLARGDQNEFVTEDESVLSVAKLSGNHWDIDRQRLGEGTPYRVATEWVGLGVYEEYERVMLGRSDWARLTRAIYDAIDAYVNEIVYNAVIAAGQKVLPGSDQFYKTAALDATTKDTFLTMVEDVQAANRGAEVVIMGTKTALSRLSNLVPVDWRAEADKEDHRNLGHIGIWEGTRVVEIPQVFKKGDTTQKLVDANKLFIMPVQDNKFIKLVYEGNAEMREITDNTTLNDMTYEYKYMTKIGVATIIGRYFGTWNIVTGG